MSAAVTAPSLLTESSSSLRVAEWDLKEHLLEIQHDLGDVLDHALDGGELVHRAIHLDRSDGRPLQRGQQHPAQRVADGVAVARFKRLGDKLGIGVGGGSSSLTNRFGISKRPRRTGIFSFQQF